MLTNSYEGELSRRFEELDAKNIQIANEESKQYQAKEQEKIEETKKRIRKLTGKNNEPEEHHEFTEEELALMTSDNPDDSLAVDDNGNVLRLVGDVRIVPQKEVKFEDGTVIPDKLLRQHCIQRKMFRTTKQTIRMQKKNFQKLT